jgi:GNAT superfamily N-acetyltransferase
MFLVAMAIRITESEFQHVLALLRSMLVEAGLGKWEIDPWLAKAAARLAQNHQDGTGAYFLEYVDGSPVGMVGASLHDHHAFLSLKIQRYGCVVDAYVLPAHRRTGLEQQLRADAVAWIRQAGAVVLDAPPPNVARLAAISGGGKL